MRNAHSTLRVHKRARVDHQAHLHRLGWRVVRPQVVPQTVVEGSDQHIGIDPQRRRVQIGSHVVVEVAEVRPIRRRPLLGSHGPIGTGTSLLGSHGPIGTGTSLLGSHGPIGTGTSLLGSHGPIGTGTSLRHRGTGHRGTGNVSDQICIRRTRGASSRSERSDENSGDEPVPHRSCSVSSSRPFRTAQTTISLFGAGSQLVLDPVDRVADGHGLGSSDPGDLA